MDEEKEESAVRSLIRRLEIKLKMHSGFRLHNISRKGYTILHPRERCKLIQGKQLEYYRE